MAIDKYHNEDGSIRINNRTGVPYGQITPQQEQYCKFYVEHFNRSEAARQAGYSKKTAGQIAAQIMELPQVQARIDELLLERRHKYEVTELRMQEEIRRIAFSDITEIYNTITELEEQSKVSNGGEIEKGLVGGLTIMDIKKLPVEIRACIRKIQPTRFGITIEFYDKVDALTMLARHFGYFEKDNKQKETNVVGVYLPDNSRGDFAGTNAEAAAKMN